MKNNQNTGVGVTLLGLILILGGLFMVKTLNVFLENVAYISVGLGCGLFGHGLGELFLHRIMQKDPSLKRKKEIEESDERNITIKNRAQAKAYRMMLSVFGTLLITFGLMGIEMRVILLLATAYLYVCLYGLYYSVKYHNEM